MSLILTQQDIRKREFWEPCTSKEELYWHIKTFLKIDLPQYIVDERSTSTPLDFIWSVYETMLTNAGSMRHVVATSRNCMKTLSSAIIHFYAIIHFRRDTIQLAAIRPQSLACIRYLDKFLTIDEVKQYSNINNKDAKILQNMPANYFTIKHDAKVQVAVGTLEGVNSLRGSCFTGSTEILVPYYERTRVDRGRYKNYTLDGIYKRFQKGEELNVISINPQTLVLEEKPILAVRRQINTERLLITLNTNKTIECTEEHLLSYEYDGQLQYKQANTFKPNDRILIKNHLSNNTVDAEFMQSIEVIEKQEFDGSLISFDDVIVGSLLGDGCLYRKTKNGVKVFNADFSITKTASAEPYLEYLVSIMQPIVPKVKINHHSYSGYTGKQQCQLTTGLNAIFTPLYNKWYPNGKKIVPKDLKITWGVLNLQKCQAFLEITEPVREN